MVREVGLPSDVGGKDVFGVPANFLLKAWQHLKGWGDQSRVFASAFIECFPLIAPSFFRTDTAILQITYFHVTTYLEKQTPGRNAANQSGLSRVNVVGAPPGETPVPPVPPGVAGPRDPPDSTFPWWVGGWPVYLQDILFNSWANQLSQISPLLLRAVGYTFLSENLGFPAASRLSADCPFVLNGFQEITFALGEEKHLGEIASNYQR